MSQPARSEGAGIEVVLESLETSDRPSCPHGTSGFGMFTCDMAMPHGHEECPSGSGVTWWRKGWTLYIKGTIIWYMYTWGMFFFSFLAKCNLFLYFQI